MESGLKGVWRTYKVFFFSGKLERHSYEFYNELSIDEQGTLIHLQSQNKRAATVYTAAQWHIEAVKQRRYLYVGKRQAYEIITLETQELVLAEVISGQKLFYAKMPGWHQRIEPVVNTIRHITPDKKQSSH